MEKSKIFIASSGRAIDLEKILKEELSTEFCEAYIWSEESKNKISLAKIEMLEKATKEFDFAVLILFRDDWDFKASGDEAQRIALYNCIIEAGQFMGTLGRDRCFLVTDVKSCDIPVYLNGIIYAPFDSLEDSTNHEECRRAVLQTSVAIKDTVQRKGKFFEREYLSLLPFEELFRKEKPLCQGGELEEGVVVVSDVQPLVHYEFVAQVKKNLDHGVRYVCFFPANVDGSQKICWVLQMILLTDFIEDSKQADSFQDRLKIMEKNRDQILKELQEICKRDSLMICFTQDEPSLQFRIHNATSHEKARLYIRYDNRSFIELAGSERAMNMWSYMQKFFITRGAKKVFHWTIPLENDEKNKEDFKKSIIQELKKYFPEIHEHVKKLCFAENEG